MKQIWIPKHGAADVLELRDAPDPMPNAGEVRIRVESIGVNFADVVARIGVYPDAPKPPFVPGYEVAGLVDAVGEGIDSDWLNVPAAALTRFGGYSSVACVPLSQVFRLPKNLSADEAAALPLNTLTAYQMLVVMGSVRPGNTVLVHGAAGGVGWMAVQMAKLLGATVYGTASAHKHEALYSLGVSACIDYTNTDFVSEIHKLTNGKGVELVLDPIGGAHWMKSYRTLAATGRLVMCGQAGMISGQRRNVWTVLKWALGVPWLTINHVRLINENKGLIGVNLGRMWDEVDRMRPWFEEILTWHQAGKLSVKIDRIYALEEAARAHDHLQNRQNIGKVLLKSDQ